MIWAPLSKKETRELAWIFSWGPWPMLPCWEPLRLGPCVSSHPYFKGMPRRNFWVEGSTVIALQGQVVSAGIFQPGRQTYTYMRNNGQCGEGSCEHGCQIPNYCRERVVFEIGTGKLSTNRRKHNFPWQTRHLGNYYKWPFWQMA